MMRLVVRLIGVFALTIGALSLVGCEPGPRYPKKSKKELAERARIKAAGEKYWADMPEYNYYKMAGHYYQVPTKKHMRRLILGGFHSREPKLIRETTRLTMERCCEGVEYYFPVKATNGSSFFQGGFVVGDSAIDHITGFHPVKNFHFLDTSSERHYSKFPSFTDQFYLISWKKIYEHDIRAGYAIGLVSKRPLFFNQHIALTCNYTDRKNVVPNIAGFSGCFGRSLDPRKALKQEVAYPPQFYFRASSFQSKKKNPSLEEVAADFATTLAQFQVMVENMHLGDTLPEEIKAQGIYEISGEP